MANRNARASHWQHLRPLSEKARTTFQTYCFELFSPQLSTKVDRFSAVSATEKQQKRSVNGKNKQTNKQTKNK